MTGGARLQIGELAKRTGVSVRTLHHYEAIGLLTPAMRTEAGYRLYDDAEILRLQQIRSLRQLGFSLDRIRTVLDGDTVSLLDVIDLHIRRLNDQIVAQQRLVDRLSGIASVIRSEQAVTTDDLLRLIEEITKVESYYTPEQLQELEERRNSLGEAAIRRAEADWATLIDDVKHEMAAGTDPTSERVKALAARWQTLVQSFTGGNPGIAQSLQKMWSQEESIHGYDTSEMRALGQYLAKTAEN